MSYDLCVPHFCVFVYEIFFSFSLHVPCSFFAFGTCIFLFLFFCAWNLFYFLRGAFMHWKIKNTKKLKNKKKMEMDCPLQLDLYFLDLLVLIMYDFKLIICSIISITCLGHCGIISISVFMYHMHCTLYEFVSETLPHV